VKLLVSFAWIPDDLFFYLDITDRQVDAESRYIRQDQLAEIISAFSRVEQPASAGSVLSLIDECGWQEAEAIVEQPEGTGTVDVRSLLLDGAGRDLMLWMVSFPVTASLMTVGQGQATRAADPGLLWGTFNMFKEWVTELVGQPMVGYAGGNHDDGIPDSATFWWDLSGGGGVVLSLEVNRVTMDLLSQEGVRIKTLRSVRQAYHDAGESYARSDQDSTSRAVIVGTVSEAEVAALFDPGHPVRGVRGEGLLDQDTATALVSFGSLLSRGNRTTVLQLKLAVLDPRSWLGAWREGAWKAVQRKGSIPDLRGWRSLDDVPDRQSFYQAAMIAALEPYTIRFWNNMGDTVGWLVSAAASRGIALDREKLSVDYGDVEWPGSQWEFLEAMFDRAAGAAASQGWRLYPLTDPGFDSIPACVVSPEEKKKLDDIKNRLRGVL